MIVRHASFPIDAERRGETRDHRGTVVEQSNREDGAIEYRAAVDVEDENTIRFLERYEDADAVDAHDQTEHFQTSRNDFPNCSPASRRSPDSRSATRQRSNCRVDPSRRTISGQSNAGVWQPVSNSSCLPSSACLARTRSHTSSVESPGSAT
ncbi:putative quinol monooxygenase [Halorubrum sp. 48-1-W]|uniref:putative quinol monooxygenase n=1 Tax=Halorubrum sp. 48-1-W TaxID=2249761 RepID=UPI001F542C7D|nr:putative quinol monooxygenase [Halorubrum sp. 48-1-W]